MYPAPFNYYRPSSLEDAIALLMELGEDCKIMSGGQSLIPMMKLRVGEPAPVIDIARIPALSYIKQVGDVIHIGALTPHQKIANSDIAAALPFMKDCGGGIADHQVRSRGTIGGSVSAADPNCDWPTLMKALNADIVCTGPKGERIVNIADFIVDAYTTTIEPAELVTEVRFTLPAGNQSGAYVVFKKSAPAYPSASAAVFLELDENNVCQQASFALGCAAPVAVRSSNAEAYLVGKAVNDDNLEQTAQRLVACAQPKGNAQNSEEYQTKLFKAVFIEAANRTISRCHNETVTKGHLYA